MTDVPQPPAFDNDDAYERSLSDPSFWAPYARAALKAAGFPDDGEVITHFPTTHVAALVGDHHLVKLHYEEWFGEDCFQTEREAYTLLSRADLPIPELLAEGALYDDGWRWPFLVMTAIHGRSMRELDGSLSTEDLERTANFVGITLRKLHATPIRDGEYISFEEYADLIRTRMARCHRDHELWGSLPERFLSQVRDYVWSARDLLEPNERRTSLLHGDLHAGNVFLNGDGGAHEPTGIVDFNDAYEGDPHYDLVAIHAKAFGADKRLLRRSLDAYGWGELGRKWPQRMMALTLAHDYDMVQPYAARIPDEVRTLEELASLLWDLDAPGLP
jgi:aminoglycoside phosphotransferase (APT) family kinase protein